VCGGADADVSFAIFISHDLLSVPVPQYTTWARVDTNIRVEDQTVRATRAKSQVTTPFMIWCTPWAHVSRSFATNHILATMLTSTTASQSTLFAFQFDARHNPARLSAFCTWWSCRYDKLPDEVAEEREIDNEVDAKVLMLVTQPLVFGADPSVLQVPQSARQPSTNVAALKNECCSS